MLTSVCLHGTTEKQSRGIWFHFDPDFPHFPDPPCGFRDSGDLSLFWTTRSYQGKRRFEGGWGGVGVLQLEGGVIFNSSVLQVFNSRSKVLDIAPLIFFPLRQSSKVPFLTAPFGSSITHQVQTFTALVIMLVWSLSQV